MTTNTNKLKLFLSSPFLLLLLLIFNPVKVFGQGQEPIPDCVVFINVTLSAQATVRVPTAATSGGVGDNRTLGCQSYTLTYQTAGTGALTGVDFQSGQSATTTVTFATWAGTVVTGINPNTSSTGATSTFTTGCANAVECNIPNSWIQVLITRGTFVGTINGVLYGYRSGYPGGGGGGTSTGCPSPCPVEGVDAAGAAPTVPPVYTAGFDGTDVRPIRTDTTGRPNVVGAAASGAANAGNPVKIGGPFNTTQPTVTNGQAVDAQMTARGAQIVAPGVDGFPVTTSPFCTLSAPITFSAASGAVQIVGLSSGKVIQVCHLSISSSVATNLTIEYGTGSACGTGTNALSGAYNNVTTLALDLNGTLNTPASQELCISSSATITAGGMVTYAQF